MVTKPRAGRWGVVALVMAVVAGLGVSAPADAARTVSRLTLTASSTHVALGDTLTFTTAAAAGQFRRGDRIRLQRLVGRTWTTVRTTSLDRSGRSTVSLDPDVGRHQYRAARAGRPTDSASAPIVVRVDRGRTSITSTLSESRVVAGSRVFVTGAVPRGSFDVGDPVDLRLRPSGALTWPWSPTATGRLGRDGRVELQVRPAVGSWEVQLVKVRTRRWSSSVSATGSFAVARADLLTVHGERSTVPVGQAVALRGQLTSATCTDATDLVLQELRAGRWTTLADRVEVDDDCDVLAVTRAATAGPTRFRIGATAAAGRAGVVSNVVTVALTRATPLRLVPDGRPTTLFVDAAGQAGSATFTTVRGQRYGLTVDGAGFARDGSTPLRVLDPAGTEVPLDVTPAGDGPAVRWSLTASAAGEHTVVVDPADDSTGRVRLQLSTPSTTQAIAGGAPVTVSTGEVVGSELRVAFTGPKDDVVSLSPVSTTTWDPARIRLVDVASSTVVTGSDGRWLLDHDGEYRFELEPRGDARLAAPVAVLAAGRAATELDRSMDVSLDRPGTLRRYRVTARAGQQVSAAITRVAVQGDGDATSTAVVELRSSRGDVVSRLGGSTRQQDLYVPLDGVLDIDVSATSRGTGTLRLDLSTPVTTTTTLDGPAVSQSSDGLAGRELGVELEARAGDVVWPELVRRTEVVEVRQDLVEVRTGTTVPARSGADDDVWVIPRDGRYRLEHSSLPVQPAVLDLVVGVHRADPATDLVPDATGAQRVTVQDGRRISVLRYTAQRDETLSLGVTDDSVSTGPVFGSRSSIFQSTAPWILDVTDGDARVASLQSGSGSATLTVRAGRTYTVTLDALRSGSLSLNLRGPTDRSVDAEVDGAAVPLSDGNPDGRTTTVRFAATAGQVLSLDLGTYPVYGLAQPLRLRRAGTGDAVASICQSQQCDDEGNGDPVWIAPESGTYELAFQLANASSTPVSVAVIGVQPRPLANDGVAQRLAVDRPGGTAAVVMTAPPDGGSVDVTTGPTTFRTADGPVRVPAVAVDPGPLVRLFWRLTDSDVRVSLRPLADPSATIVVINPPGQATGSVELAARAHGG